MTRPIDIAPASLLDWCTCGQRIWGHDRTEFAASWYGHLADAVRSDPDGEHALGRTTETTELDGDGIPTHVAGASADSWRYDQ